LLGGKTAGEAFASTKILSNTAFRLFARKTADEAFASNKIKSNTAFRLLGRKTAGGAFASNKILSTTAFRWLGGKTAGELFACNKILSKTASRLLKLNVEFTCQAYFAREKDQTTTPPVPYSLPIMSGFCNVPQLFFSFLLTRVVSHHSSEGKT